MMEEDGGTLIAAPPDTHDNDEAERIFTEALTNLQDAAKSALGKSVPIVALTIPRHFNTSTWRSVFAAATKVAPQIEQPWQLVPLAHAARLAYAMTSCEGLNITGGECDMEEGLHEIMFLDRGSDSLELSVADFTEQITSVEHHLRLTGLSEDESENSMKVREALENLTSRAFVAESPRKNRFESLRAIIISGDASPSAIQALHVEVRRISGLENSIVRSSIDPMFVGAVGAAHQAMLFALNPEELQDTNCPGHAPDFVHDEL